MCDYGFICREVAGSPERLRPIKLSDVPFPKENEVGDARWKVLARRWHPDKFGQRFGHQLYKSDAEKIMERVKQVFQRLSGARSNS